jgi:hypothetical protein
MPVRVFDEGDPEAAAEEGMRSPVIDGPGAERVRIRGLDIVGPERDARTMPGRDGVDAVAVGGRPGEREPESEPAEGIPIFTGGTSAVRNGSVNPNCW